MLRLVLRQLRHRGGRALTMGLAILVAAAGFTVLTASSAASRLQTVGTVRAHAKGLYDILVRPSRSATAVESAQGLVQPGFLTGVYGGITLAQWRQIKATPGVSVAAPIAMVGSMVLPLELPVDMLAALPAQGSGVARMDVTWSYDNGLSKVKTAPNYTYLTSQRLPVNEGSLPETGMFLEGGTPSAGSSARAVCPDAVLAVPKNVSDAPPLINCFSRTSGGLPAFGVWSKALVGQELAFPLPVVLAAVDPKQEDLLDGLDSAVTSGRGLVGAPLTNELTMSKAAVPVLVAPFPATEVNAAVTLSRLGPAAAGIIERGLKSAPTRTALAAVPGSVISRRVITAAAAYPKLVQGLTRLQPVPGHGDDGLTGNVYWYNRVSGPLVSGETVRVAGTSHYSRFALGLNPRLVPGSDDTSNRSMTQSVLYPDKPGGDVQPATLVRRGTFDPGKLTGLEELTSRILSGYSPAPTSGADARSKRLLGHGALAPSPNIGGFVQPPPLMLTTLAALPLLTTGGWDPTTAAAPISAVRVRVAGVSGVDPISRERVRLAAQRIVAATGLQVDVTVGSSPTARTLTLPPGRYGRPELSLAQYWLKKGVAVAILTAVDKKSLVLFVLVLLVCTLTVANTAVASVRARRTELGVLACLGWRRRHLLTLVLAELAVVAAAAGLAAAALSLLLGAALGTPVSPARAVLAVPAALLVALLAGSVPAWLATRAQPMEAVRPAVSAPRSARTPRSVPALGLVNLVRTKARVAVAASGLLIAVAAFTLLLAITVAFQGAVVGTLLGDAVTVQARTADYAATAAILLLASAGVANVLYLNIRDRGPEIATLRSVGWHERHLTRMVLVEGLGIALVGSLPGAALGVAAAAVLAGGISTPLVGAAVLATATGIVIAMTAAAVPVALLRRLPTALLLTEQ